MKRALLAVIMMFLGLCLSPSPGMCAYKHGETDSPKFLEVYPAKSVSKLNSCELCHTGTNKSPVGTCTWCHTKYGYTGTGKIADTLNEYGKAFLNAGRDANAIETIKGIDSDGDGYTNDVEINANSYPGYAGDKPGLKAAPSKVYTMAQIEAMPKHSQFMLMNTTKQVDSYGTYSGVTIKDLLDDAGIDLENAESISVYSLDGYSAFYPLYPMPDDVTDPSKPTILYHVYGNMTGQSFQYPQADYWYKTAADKVNSGWCDYSAPSCTGRNPGDSIVVEKGLKAILAYMYEGAYLVDGVINSQGKLDGEGPFRVVVPQKYSEKGWPDLQSTKPNPAEEWNYDPLLDHNAGMCAKSAIVIRVDPLPEGTTDIDTKAAFESFDEGKMIVIYGAITKGDDSYGKVSPSGEETVAESDDSDNGWCFVNTALSSPVRWLLSVALGFILLLFSATIRRSGRTG